MIPAWARTWVLERGILYAMIQTPLLALLAGFFYRVVPYRFMLLPVMASFVALPTWISYRRRVSTNPDEPVHHLHKYALWALLPAAMFTLGRIPLLCTSGIIYWHPWYDDQVDALVPGPRPQGLGEPRPAATHEHAALDVEVPRRQQVAGSAEACQIGVAHQAAPFRLAQ